ncbi:MAG: MFS transporter [Clostridia bacterium]|nr:MFS transporter [Clostridia bacterium]
MEKLEKINVDEKVTKTSISVLLFIICCIVYATAYIARINYSTAISAMQTHGVLTEDIAGLISAVYFVMYAVGQFINGILSDKKSPFLLIIIGVSLIILAEVAMFTVYKPSFLMIIWWGVNGFGQSMLWTPVFYIINNALNPKIRYKAITLIALTTPVGKISGYTLSGFSLNIGGWKGVFVMASLIMAFSLIIFVTFYLVNNKNIILQTNPRKNKLKVEKDTSQSLFKLLITSGFIIVFPALIVHGLFLNGAAEWIPTILKKTYLIKDSDSAFITMIIPVIGLLGVFIGEYITAHVFKDDEIKATIFFMSISLVSVLVLYWLTFNVGGIWGYAVEAVIFASMYGLLYMTQLAINHLLISFAPMHFNNLGFAASVSGIANAINYGGSAISTYGIGLAMQNNMTPNTLMLVWIICLVVAIVALLIALKPWKKFSSSIGKLER